MEKRERIKPWNERALEPWKPRVKRSKKREEKKTFFAQCITTALREWFLGEISPLLFFLSCSVDLFIFIECEMLVDSEEGSKKHLKAPLWWHDDDNLKVKHSKRGKIPSSWKDARYFHLLFNSPAMMMTIRDYPRELARRAAKLRRGVSIKEIWKEKKRESRVNPPSASTSAAEWQQILSSAESSQRSRKKMKRRSADGWEMKMLGHNFLLIFYRSLPYSCVFEYELRSSPSHRIHTPALQRWERRNRRGMKKYKKIYYIMLAVIGRSCRKIKGQREWATFGVEMLFSPLIFSQFGPISIQKSFLLFNSIS